MRLIDRLQQSTTTSTTTAYDSTSAISVSGSHRCFARFTNRRCTAIDIDADRSSIVAVVIVVVVGCAAIEQFRNEQCNATTADIFINVVVDDAATCQFDAARTRLEQLCNKRIDNECRKQCCCFDI